MRLLTSHEVTVGVHAVHPLPVDDAKPGIVRALCGRMVRGELIAGAEPDCDDCRAVATTPKSRRGLITGSGTPLDSLVGELVLVPGSPRPWVGAAVRIRGQEVLIRAADGWREQHPASDLTVLGHTALG